MDNIESNQEEGSARSVRFGVVVEQSQTQRVRCETRDGIEVFVFDGGGDTKTTVPVESYMKILEEARSNPNNNSYGIPNYELV